MKCIRPTQFEKNGSFLRCGQCMPCRILRRTEWTTRLSLEYRYNNNLGSFVTLTYNDEHLPDSGKYPCGNLKKPDLQKFIKRFRKKLGTGKRVSYFAVGEYGGRKQRAHYHICIFGLDYPIVKRLVPDAWSLKGESLGFTTVSDLSKDGFERMRYTVGYTLKKMTSESAVDRLHGDDRNPEFPLMSKNPALGLGMMPSFVAPLLKHLRYPARGIDRITGYYIEKHYPEMVPWHGLFKWNGRNMILDAYLQKKLFQLMYPDIIRGCHEFNEKTDFDVSEIYTNYIHNRNYFSRMDNIKFMTGVDYEQAKKQSDKEERKYTKAQETSKL